MARELDEKYTSIIPYEDGRIDVMNKMKRVFLIYRIAMSKPFDEERHQLHSHDREKKSFIDDTYAFIWKRWCSQHLTQDEFRTFQQYILDIIDNLNHRRWPNRYSYKEYVDQVNWD